jgi:hypothetical protein
MVENSNAYIVKRDVDVKGPIRRKNRVLNGIQPRTAVLNVLNDKFYSAMFR